jgi:hypothetical protein
MIGRLVLSDRNIYKINNGNKNFTARKCLILSEFHNDILIKSSKDFNQKDEYVKINPESNTIIDGLGLVGGPQSDMDIYFHIYTLDWMSKSKYNKLWEQVDTSFDLATTRTNYYNRVITIDPLGSIDLDDGFSFSFDDKYYYLDIHISDPISLINPNNSTWIDILKELFTRLQTCYVGTNPTHLLPEKIVRQISLLELDLDQNIKSRRAISFCFKINTDTNTYIDFELKFTNLVNIKNYTYENYDHDINLMDNLETKTNLVSITNKLINMMGVKLDLISLDTDISHRIIEVFMIFTNWYGGNYLINKNWTKTIIRTQDSKIFSDDFDINQVPRYARPILSYGANYSYGLASETNIEANTHHTLGINNYAHISSPMRRVIDMINHLGLYKINLENIIPDFDKYVDLDKINSKLKNYKKISNAYGLVCFIKNSTDDKKKNIFKACLFDWVKLDNSNQINCMLVLYNEQNNFIKVVNVELPQIELTQNLKKYMEFDIELFYNPNKFKSNKFPFSIKIL